MARVRGLTQFDCWGLQDTEAVLNVQGIDIKYIDPTYMIRAIPTTTNDRIYCKVLGQGAVHGAFAGFTGCTVGLINTHYVYLPIPVIIQASFSMLFLGSFDLHQSRPPRPLLPNPTPLAPYPSQCTQDCRPLSACN